MLNYKKAAKIIGEHFSEIDDKLLNILQLGELSGKDNDLVNASIQQKIDKIKSISFSNAINFGENKKHIKNILPDEYGSSSIINDAYCKIFTSKQDGVFVNSTL